MMRCSLAMCVLSAAVPAALADVTFSDGTFDPAGWGFETVVLGAGGVSTPSQVPGGNPGDARQVINAVNGGGTVWGVSRFGTTNTTRYVPATHGAIQSVDFRIDHRFVSGFGADGQAVMLAAKQGTVVFAAAPFVTGSSGLWNTTQLTGITAAAFTPLDNSSAVIDFSATGEPIRFGFAAGNSSQGGGYINTVVYDNFEVVVRSVTGCYPNCDGSTAAPALNVADFTCFLQRFAAGESYANCDQSTAAPVLNVADFTCFLQSFAGGCP